MLTTHALPRSPLVALLLAGLGCSTGQGAKPDAARAPAPAGGAKERSFHFEYATSVSVAPAAGKRIRVWIPLPGTDEAQTITNLKVDSPITHRETRDPLYGNLMAYFEVEGPQNGPIPIRVSFDARRVETTHLRGLAGGLAHERCLAGDRLAPAGGEPARRAVESVAGKSGVPDKAHAIYDRVVADVAYDKTGQGWGRGDTSYVCSVGKGNCSDFHALFISMARSQRIPALFEIGFPIPVGKSEGAIAGYHCWAWYEDEAGDWHPVDASEADKDPSRKEYFFGTVCCNRVALSRGRDLVLEPPQAGEPLNFFVYPYVEVDGKALDGGVERTFSFRDI